VEPGDDAGAGSIAVRKNERHVVYFLNGHVAHVRVISLDLKDVHPGRNFRVSFDGRVENEFEACRNDEHCNNTEDMMRTHGASIAIWVH